MPIPIEPQGDEYLARNVARMNQRREARNAALGGGGDFLDIVDEMAQRDRESGTDVGGGLAPAQQPDRGTPVMMAAMGDGGGARAPSVAGAVMGRTSGGTPVMQAGLFGGRGIFGGGVQTRSSGGSSPCGPNGCPTGVGARAPAQQSPAQTQTAAAIPAPATTPVIPETFSPQARAALEPLQQAITAGQTALNNQPTGMAGAAQIAPMVAGVTAAQQTFYGIYEREVANSSPEAQQIVAQGIEHRELTNKANRLTLAEAKFGSFANKAAHQAAILGQTEYQMGDTTINYFGMPISLRAKAFADIELATSGKSLTEEERSEFYKNALEDAAGTIAAYDIASRLSSMEAGNPDMEPAARAAARIGDQAPELEGNVQRATLDAAIDFYSGMKDETGAPLSGDVLRAKIVSHLGGNLSAFLSADYAEEFPSVPKEQIASIAAEDAYLVANSFADSVMEKQSGGGRSSGAARRRVPVSGISKGVSQQEEQ